MLSKIKVNENKKESFCHTIHSFSYQANDVAEEMIKLQRVTKSLSPSGCSFLQFLPTLQHQLPLLVDATRIGRKLFCQTIGRNGELIDTSLNEERKKCTANSRFDERPAENLKSAPALT